MTLQGGVVKVLFTDGHNMSFKEGGDSMRAPINALDRVWLGTGTSTLVTFNSRHQHPVNHRPFGFVQAVAGWNPQRFATYWSAALEYADKAQAKGQLIDVARVLNMGRQDLAEIKNNQWLMPASKRR
jgi:hypothetical protein